IVLDILLARPDHLDRTIDLLGDLDGTGGAVFLETPAKPTTEQMVVDDDLVQRQSGNLRGSGLYAHDRLAADPDFAIVLAHMDSAIHRLHGRVREEWNLVGRFDLRRSVRQCLVDIANALRNRSRLERRGFELPRDVLRGQLRVRAVVPFDLERREALLGGPHVIGDNGHSVVEAHDLTHALYLFRRTVVDALQTASENWRLSERRDLHAWCANVDAIDSCSIDLRRKIQTLGRRADKLEIRGSF